VKKAIILIAFIILSSSISNISFAWELGKKSSYFGTIVTDNAPVRTCPGNECAQIEKLKKHDRPPLEGSYGNWVKLWWPVEGWVHKKFMAVPGDLPKVQP